MNFIYQQVNYEFLLIFCYFYINLKILEDGNPNLVARKSGVELAMEICGKEDMEFGDLEYKHGMEFWIGWIVSY